MSTKEKLKKRVFRKPFRTDITFSEIMNLLTLYGYTADSAGGGSHIVFRRDNHPIIVIPKRSPVLIAYIRLIQRQINTIEEGESNEE
jgi:predicted RNA binding protein YcfA (HicA-like mRNA interferase family)